LGILSAFNSTLLVDVVVANSTESSEDPVEANTDVDVDVDVEEAALVDFA
jgi:hypothetical protein